MGITHPSVKGQERVVRMAYQKANLDPNLTAYAELHGTGTPVGDPIEVRAISRAMNDTRPADKPLLVGAGRDHVTRTFGIININLVNSKTEHWTFRGGEWHLRCDEGSLDDRVVDNSRGCIFPEFEPSK